MTRWRRTAAGPAPGVDFHLGRAGLRPGRFLSRKRGGRRASRRSGDARRAPRDPSVAHDPPGCSSSSLQQPHQFLAVRRRSAQRTASLGSRRGRRRCPPPRRPCRASRSDRPAPRHHRPSPGRRRRRSATRSAPAQSPRRAPASATTVASSASTSSGKTGKRRQHGPAHHAGRVGHRRGRLGGDRPAHARRESAPRTAATARARSTRRTSPSMAAMAVASSRQQLARLRGAACRGRQACPPPASTSSSGVR